MKKFVAEGIELEYREDASLLNISDKQFAVTEEALLSLRDVLCGLPLRDARTRQGYEALCRRQAREVLLTPDGRRNALVSYLRTGGRVLDGADCVKVLKGCAAVGDEASRALLQCVPPSRVVLDRGRPEGVVLSYRDAEGKVRIGWAMYHSTREKLPPSRYIGIMRAVRMSHDLGALLGGFLHHSVKEVLDRKLLMNKSVYLEVLRPLRPLWLRMTEQAAAFFGLVPKQEAARKEAKT